MKAMQLYQNVDLDAWLVDSATMLKLKDRIHWLILILCPKKRRKRVDAKQFLANYINQLFKYLAISQLRNAKYLKC